MACQDMKWRYGCMKNAVSEQLTTDDCQKVAMLMGLKPAVAERVKSGLDLLSQMEQKAELSKDNVKQLRKYLVEVDLLLADGEVGKYQNYLESESAQPVPENHVEDSTDGIQDNNDKPDYGLPHMKDGVTECNLSSVASKLGDKYRQFCLQKLKLTKAEIDICKHAHRDNLPDIVFDCLYEWRKNIGSRATNGELAKLLYEFPFTRDVWGLLEVPPESPE